MTPDKATPRPWHYEPRGIVDAGGYLVANTQYNPPARDGDSTAHIQANADLIVRAVNSYDAHRKLVEAVRSHLASVEGPDGWLGGRNKLLREALRTIEESNDQR